MRLAEGRRHAHGEAQEVSHLHRRSKQAAEQFATGIFEHQNGPTAISQKLQRPHGPCAVKLLLQGGFVDKTIEGGRRRLLRGRQHGQHAITPTFCAVSPPSAESEPVFLTEDLKATESDGAEPGSQLQNSNPRR